MRINTVCGNILVTESAYSLAKPPLKSRSKTGFTPAYDTFCGSPKEFIQYLVFRQTLQTECAMLYATTGGAGRLQPPSGRLPVSYTHLDVYKRQGPDRELLEPPVRQRRRSPGPGVPDGRWQRGGSLALL